MASTNVPKAREQTLASLGYMSRPKLAQLIGVTVRTVENRRDMPPRCKLGRDVVYRIADVEAWMARRVTK